MLLRAGAAVGVGVRTDELDEIAHDTYLEFGAYPSTLRYRGYPKSICTSVNERHLPRDPRQPSTVRRRHRQHRRHRVHRRHARRHVGDVLGRAPERGDGGLIETTRLATLRGIDAIRPFEPLQRVAEAIEPFAAARGYGVVREYGGHGIGATFHADPHVAHHIDRRDDVIVIPGIELHRRADADDGKPSFSQAADGLDRTRRRLHAPAQFEHTVVVTESGAEILTVTERRRQRFGNARRGVGRCRAPSGRDSRW